MLQYHTQAQFARECGVSREAIRRRINCGALHLEGKRIDLLHPLNAEYFVEKTGIDLQGVVLDNNPASAPKKKNRSSIRKKAPAPEKKEPVPPKKQRTVVKTVHPDTDTDVDPENLTYKQQKTIGDKTKIAVEMEKVRAQTANFQLKYAKDMDILIEKKRVDQAFGMLASTIVNHFLPMGDRLSDLIASEAGITDPEIKLKIGQRINKENSRTLEEIKRVCMEAVDGN